MNVLGSSANRVARGARRGAALISSSKRRAVVVFAAGMTIASLGQPIAATAADGSVSATTASAQALTNPVAGVDLYAPSNYTQAQVQQYGQTMMSYIKNTLKADAVGIVWDFFSPGYHSNVVKATAKTLTPQNVAILTQIAQADGLQVEYRPLIFVKGVSNPWEGLIRPSSPKTWFTSYFKAEKPYLKVAQQYKVGEFVAGTELRHLTNRSQWKSFFSRVSSVYHGTVSYTAFDQDWLKKSPLPVHNIGMDMYHGMKLPNNATTAQVTRAWEHWIGQMPRSILRRTAIDETGIEARAGAYRRPWDLAAPGRLNQKIQYNWFTAACRTVHKYHMRGVFFWKVNLADNPANPSKALSVFENRRGAQAISNCASIIH